MNTVELYDEDFFQWTQCNASVLRSGAVQNADLEHIAEEIEDMGKRHRQAAVNRMRVLIMHLLKYRFQPGKRSPSWTRTIIEQRRRLHLIFEDSPSLRSYVLEHIDAIYAHAAQDAMIEMSSKDIGLPEACPWRMDAILDPKFWPK
jgi:hypothetical protein